VLRQRAFGGELDHHREVAKPQTPWLQSRAQRVGGPGMRAAQHQAGRER
jgi:hypothetical protein